MLQKIINKLMGLEPPNDNTFVFLLQKEFWHHLRLARTLKSIPESKRSHSQEFLLDYLKRTYVPNGSCPSAFYPYVSKKLQNNYQEIHKRICDALYD
jgi:hypothetical protein